MNYSCREDGALFYQKFEKMKSCRNKWKSSSAYALIEIALVVLISGLMYGMMAPAYTFYVDNTKIQNSEEVLKDMGRDIEDYFYQNGVYPDSLEEVYGEIPLDEWGNPYQYLRIDGGSMKGKGKLRKDKNLVPINSDFDLYSMGPDGQSASPLTANLSKDDIVRGRNGEYIGAATDF